MAHALLIIPLLLRCAGYVPENNLHLTIRIYVNNDRKLWTYALDMNMISVTRHSLHSEPDRVLLQRNLTLEEIKKLDTFFARYPLQRLEKQYVDERIHGDTCTMYHIMVNAGGKDVYIYYARPGNILELNRILNRLLPRQYRLWDEEM